MADSLDELRALEREVEREWWWLNGALHAVAEAQAEWSTGKLQSFRAMQAQAREVDRREGRFWTWWDGDSREFWIQVMFKTERDERYSNVPGLAPGPLRR